MTNRRQKLLEDGLMGRSAGERSGIPTLSWENEVSPREPTLSSLLNSLAATNKKGSTLGDRLSAFEESAAEASETLDLLAELLCAASETLQTLAERAPLGGAAFAQHRDGLCGLSEAFSTLSETLSVASERILDPGKPLSQSLLDHLNHFR